MKANAWSTTSSTPDPTDEQTGGNDPVDPEPDLDPGLAPDPRHEVHENPPETIPETRSS
jgi:hypothetical protein